MAHTELGSFETPVDADGVATIWWLGDDPTIIFKADVRPLHHGSMLLREGCR